MAKTTVNKKLILKVQKLGLELVIVIKVFEFYLVTQSLFYNPTWVS
jgi:hypothetical protein